MKLEEAVDHLKKYTRLELALALFCALSPLLMIWGESWSARESISAFYSMGESQLFYVPLTAAAMLFLVNGFVREQNLYNAWLGAALAGVVLFNHTDHPVWHLIFAGAFFLGNGVAMIAFSKGVSIRFRLGVLAGVVLAFLAWWPLGWYSLLVAEWISLGFIAAHFLLDASKLKYKAVERHEGPTRYIADKTTEMLSKHSR